MGTRSREESGSRSDRTSSVDPAGRRRANSRAAVMTSKFLRTAVVLGLLSAIGPFAIDMYLPALPSIGDSLGASTAAVQMSLLVFFLSMGFGQIVVGPISDMIGRKAPL